MKRKIYDSLLAWKADSDRKPLILEGARQVGKTYILMEFGKCEYDNLIYINCQNNSFMQNLFTMDFDMERILRDISAYAGQGIVPGKTLIFFDEAQDAPRCVEALKYFCENAPEYAIVAAGSLVLSNTVIEPGSIWGGVPAKFIKKVDPEQAKELNQKIAHNYLMYASWYKE